MGDTIDDDMLKITSHNHKSEQSQVRGRPSSLSWRREKLLIGDDGDGDTGDGSDDGIGDSDFDVGDT